MINTEAQMFNGQDQRQHIRHTWESPVKVTSAGLGGVGLIQNISLGGVLINTDLGLSTGDEVMLMVGLPGLSDICKIKCTVRWIDAHENAGLLFNELKEEEINALKSLFFSLENDQKKKKNEASA
jgi:hypothetical protein